jgi:hypothetical protein
MYIRQRGHEDDKESTVGNDMEGMTRSCVFGFAMIEVSVRLCFRGTVDATMYVRQRGHEDG